MVMPIDVQGDHTSSVAVILGAWIAASAPRRRRFSAAELQNRHMRPRRSAFCCSAKGAAQKNSPRTAVHEDASKLLVLSKTNSKEGGSRHFCISVQ
jgi:hypothetical protein